VKTSIVSGHKTVSNRTDCHARAIRHGRTLGQVVLYTSIMLVYRTTWLGYPRLSEQLDDSLGTDESDYETASDARAPGKTDKDCSLTPEPWHSSRPPRLTAIELQPVALWRGRSPGIIVITGHRTFALPTRPLAPPPEISFADLCPIRT